MSDTFDRDEIRKRLLLRLFGHPVSLVPMLGGVAAALSPLFFQLDPAMPLFAGVVGVVVGGATVAVRALVGREAIAQRVLDELEGEAARQKGARLDGLRHRLSADEDPRDEQLLDDVLRLVARVRDDASWRGHVDVVVAADILSDLDDLFERSITALERSLVMAETAAEIHTPTARDGLLTERERLLGEVQASVDAVSHLLTQLKVMAARGAGGTEGLERIRANLSHTLAAAREAAAETGASGADTDARLRAARRRANQSKEPVR